MNAKRRQAYMLIEILQWVLVVGLALSAGFAMINRSMLVQRRSSDWLTDDVHLKNVLNQLGQDIAAADRAEIVQEEIPILILQQADRKIRYEQRDDAVVRFKSGQAGQPAEHAWTLDRCSLRWSIEQPRGGSTLVWTGVIQTVRSEEGQSTHVYRYAIASRVGTTLAAEGMP